MEYQQKQQIVDNIINGNWPELRQQLESINKSDFLDIIYSMAEINGSLEGTLSEIKFALSQTENTNASS